MIKFCLSLVNLSFVSLICQPPQTKPKWIEGKFFLPDRFEKMKWGTVF